MTAEIDQLFEALLLVRRDDDDELWQPLWELRRIASREVFDRAAERCRSPDPVRRARGADVLARVGVSIETPRNKYPEEAFAVISEMLARERESGPLDAAITALGHLSDPRSIPMIVQFIAHENSDVRFAVAFSLGHFPNDAVASRHLIDLTSDRDDDVRDWALFGLGAQSDLDSPEIREALWRGTSDSFADARMEAVGGLAKRKDERVIPILREILASDDVKMGYVEALCFMLDMERDPDDWVVDDYRQAFDKRYPPIP